MLRTMTVSEICHFSSAMRLPSTFSAEQCSRVAETVIDVLGMAHVKHSAIGDEETRGISGGQRKRVNIAMELVAKPSILFLDGECLYADVVLVLGLKDTTAKQSRSYANAVQNLHRGSMRPLRCNSLRRCVPQPSKALLSQPCYTSRDTRCSVYFMTYYY